MANTLEFENKVLEQALNNTAHKLYEMGYCWNRGICKRSFPTCKKCIKCYFQEKAFKDLIADAQDDKTKS